MLDGLIILDAPQRSEAWHEARRGIPTGSTLSRLITASGQLSSKADDFLFELVRDGLVTERKNITTPDMERGVMLEPKARANYMLDCEGLDFTDLIEVGGVFLDERKNLMISPDGLIPRLKKGIEIKCPRGDRHLKTYFNRLVPPEYVIQVQSALWVTGYDSWDFISYSEEVPKKYRMAVINVKPDKTIFTAFDKHIPRFLERLERLKNEIN